MLLKTLEKQVEEKGKDLVTYREKYNIRLQNEPPSEQNDKQKSQEDSKSSGVLVNSWSMNIMYFNNHNHFATNTGIDRGKRSHPQVLNLSIYNQFHTQV